MASEGKKCMCTYTEDVRDANQAGWPKPIKHWWFILKSHTTQTSLLPRRIRGCISIRNQALLLDRAAGRRSWPWFFFAHPFWGGRIGRRARPGPRSRYWSWPWPGSGAWRTSAYRNWFSLLQGRPITQAATRSRSLDRRWAAAYWTTAATITPRAASTASPAPVPAIMLKEDLYQPDSSNLFHAACTDKAYRKAKEPNHWASALTKHLQDNVRKQGLLYYNYYNYNKNTYAEFYE